MKFDTAKNTLQTAENQHQFFIIDGRLRESTDMLNHRYLATPDEAYQTVAALWDKEAGVVLNTDQVSAIFSLYPRDRILITLVGNTIAQDAKEAALNVLSHFLLGCKWPDYGDSVDMERFKSLLQFQVNVAGF
ncbi:hypothetical protein [Burkholderia phage FLC9]|nr:hypothetical protein [Burkholderia phage FLC9]